MALAEHCRDGADLRYPAWAGTWYREAQAAGCTGGKNVASGVGESRPLAHGLQCFAQGYRCSSTMAGIGDGLSSRRQDLGKERFSQTNYSEIVREPSQGSPSFKSLDGRQFQLAVGETLCVLASA